MTQNTLADALRKIEAIGNEPCSTTEKALDDIDRMRKVATQALLPKTGTNRR